MINVSPGSLRLFVDRVEVADNEIRILAKSGLDRGLAIGLDPVEGPVPNFA
jgi:hypothetical protein